MPMPSVDPMPLPAGAGAWRAAAGAGGVVLRRVGQDRELGGQLHTGYSTSIGVPRQRRKFTRQSTVVGSARSSNSSSAQYAVGSPVAVRHRHGQAAIGVLEIG